MNRSGRDYHLVGGRNFPAGSLNLRRGHSLTGGTASNRDADEDLDLFSRNRRSISVVASDESADASALKLGRLSVSVGTAKLTRNAADDLLSADSGKNDYDWLLTPPGTPLFPSEASEPQPKVAAPRTSSLSRSTSTTKASRLSVSQSEVSHHTARPARSSSVTRSSSLSTSQFNTYSSNNRSSSSILNTSSASVSSYTRPSSPITRSSSTARPSTPSTRSSSSRPSTPSRVRPSPSTSSTEKPRPTLTSRPSTPSSRPQTPSSRPQMSSTSTLPSARSTSRPSTPSRRNSAPSLSSAISNISTSRVSSNGRPSSRPSSPGPKIRPPQQPIVLPDFSLDTPPNLRTTLPDRPLSAGRSRPPPSATAKGNPEAAPTSSLPRRQPSPVVTRGRLSVSESNGRGGRSHSNAAADFHEPRRASHAPDMGMKKPVKNVANAPETNGFGRNISKKSLDMAIRHMDIRNGNGSLRALSNTTLFPQSIRSSTSRTQSNRAASVHPNGSSDAVSENGSWVENGSVNGNYSAKLSDLDLYESSRYDAILLKEDMKNMNWLHSVDDKSEVGSIFDGGFETLPEPFGPL